MDTLAGVTGITDPTERARAAARLTGDAAEAAEKERLHRDVGALVLHYQHGYPPVRIYRDILDIPRSAFIRMTQHKPAEWSDRLPFDADDPAAVEKFTRRHADRFRRYLDLSGQARRVRDEAVDTVLNGHDTAPVSSAELARLTGLTTARIAQLRYHHR